MSAPIGYFNSNDGTALLGFGASDQLVLDETGRLAEISAFVEKHHGRYIFLALSYDLKKETLGVHASNPNYSGTPLALLWTPQTVVRMEGESVTEWLVGEDCSENRDEIQHFFAQRNASFEWPSDFQARTAKESYLQTVRKLQEEIQYGAIYEINYCQEYFAENWNLENPIAAYFRLNELTHAPFSAYLSFDAFHLISGSPERFLKKEGDRMISQPIKGTSRRGQTQEEDEALKKALLDNPKERSENVMIVDLVRNDLSRIAQKASVQVDELFGIYSFETVHQMISTISCELKKGISFAEILEATYPMGSMTGAPKLSAVELIETHENFQRGLYSGSVGYIDPQSDFDLNVVIRSVVYNEEKKYLSCAVGGAITIQSTPEAEYEECQVKVARILKGMHAHA